MVNTIQFDDVVKFRSSLIMFTRSAAVITASLLLTEIE